MMDISFHVNKTSIHDLEIITRETIDAISYAVSVSLVTLDKSMKTG